MSVDETTDINGRYIANFVVGILSAENVGQSYLLACKEFKKINHSTMARFINDTLKILWPLGGNDEKVLLMLTDAAPYMVKTGEYLKVFYINIIGTCYFYCSYAK